jgi:hypothetical protein
VAALKFFAPRFFQPSQKKLSAATGRWQQAFGKIVSDNLRGWNFSEASFGMNRKTNIIMLTLTLFCAGICAARLANFPARSNLPPRTTVADVADVGLSAKDRDQRSRLQKTNFPSNQDMPGKGDYVVLLHGMGRTPRSLRKMEKRLLREGFSVVNLAYPSTRAPIETLATQYLARAIATQCRQPDKKIHFVTHSLGGIVLKYYLQDNTLPNLGRVVMLAPPNQGSELADRWQNNRLYRFFVGPAGQQLGTAPSSLPNRLGAMPFVFGVIAGDRSLNPLTSLLIPGADDGKVAVARTQIAGMKDFLLVHKTHIFIMQDRQVIDQTVYFINNCIFKR